jgi:hypothetical protein
MDRQPVASARPAAQVLVEEIDELAGVVELARTARLEGVDGEPARVRPGAEREARTRVPTPVWRLIAECG